MNPQDLEALKSAHETGDLSKKKINSPDAAEGNSLLILASKSGRFETVEFLLTIPEVDINLVNFWGNSSLYLASHSGHFDVVELLIKAGAKVNLTNKRGFSPLYAAVVNQHQRIVECLIKHGSLLDMVLPCAVRERIKSLYQRKINVGSKVIVTEPYQQSKKGVITLDRSDGSFNVKYDDGRVGMDIEKEFITLDDSADGDTFQDEGQLAIIECLLVNGANVNEIEEDTTVLQLAVNKKDTNLIKLLLQYDVTVNTETFLKSATNGYLSVIQKANVDVNSKDIKGQSAVYLAAERGHLPIVEFLVVEKNADVNATTSKGKTALWIAANNEKRDVATFLSSHGSDPLKIDEGAFLRAASEGKIGILEQAKDINVNCMNNRGITALMLAAEGLHVKVIEYLLLMGADVHRRRDNQTGKTALDFCLQGERRGKRNYADVDESAACCELLIAHGGTFTVFDAKGFVMAAMHGILVYIQQVVEKKGEQGDAEMSSKKNEPSIVGYKEEWGSLAIIAASETGKLPIIQYLCQHGVDVNRREPAEDNHTALTKAAACEQLETVLWLLDHKGADVNITAEEEKTALMYAAEKGNVEIVAALLERGADIDRVDVPDTTQPSYRRQTIRTPKTALGKAIRGGHAAVVQLLLEKGARPAVFESEEFFTACDRGELMVVQYVVNNKLIDINFKNAKGHTGLHLASEWGKLDIVTCLVEAGADVEQKSIGGRTALRAAAVKGRLNVVSYLLTKGANVNETDGKKGISVLSAAVSGGFREVVDCLLKFGADPTSVVYDNEVFRKVVKSNILSLVQHVIITGTIDVNSQDPSDGTAAIHLASWKGHLEIVEFLVCCPSIDVNIKDKEGETAITYALGNGSLERDYGQRKSSADSINTAIINCLVNIGVNITENAFRAAAKKGLFDFVQQVVNHGVLDLNAQGKTGETPLIVAASEGHLRIVELLLEKKVDVNAVTKIGTALMEAISSGRKDVVEALVKAGANVNLSSQNTISNSTEKTPLQFACEEKHEDIVRFLISNGASVDVRTSNGATLLMLASERGLYGIAEMFLQHGADCNAIKTDGSTALTLTIKAFNRAQDEYVDNYVNIARLLISHGADVNYYRPGGDPNLHVAVSSGDNDSLFSVLVINGANVSIKDKNGKTAFDLMSAADRLKILASMELSITLLERDDHALWFVLVQEDGETNAELYTKLIGTVMTLVSSHPVLATAKDFHGHVAMDIASKSMKGIIQSVLLWHGQYRITELQPEHISATCFVFKAVDEHSIESETGQPMKVALKLMRMKAQFLRELSARDKGFSHEYVMNVLQTHPEVGTSIMDSWKDEVNDVEADPTGQLTKVNAEKLFLLVMPLADRNLFVALKQERWAGRNLEEVRHVFVQLVHCVEHMHEKGVLHADLKTLNIVRTAGQWKLIDLDAACEIGKEPVGHKSSSAYVPPEAIYVDETADSACVRSAVAVANGEGNYALLTAHPSFDVWSLGCILYQMSTADVKPLFQGGQDDNLTDDHTEVDNLFALAEWSTELKTKKLSRVADKMGRNLLSQMLHKDPLQRPSLARVLAHPFLSGKKVARLLGDKPIYDIFLSYRVASDAHHVEKLYNLLTTQGFKVYWDKLCLQPGVDWEQGFCEGLLSSRAFVPLLSRDAINHPEKDWQNFSKLTPDSKCDNVFLEHRLAVELQGLGLIEKVFPVFVGNLDSTTSKYSNYFGSGCHPSLPNVAVKAVEDKLRHHMESQALGTPIEPDRTITSVLGAITACQGAFIEGDSDTTFAAAAASIAKMLTDVPVMARQTSSLNNQTIVASVSPRGGTHVHVALLENKGKEIASLTARVTHLEGVLDGVVSALNVDFNNVEEGKAMIARVQTLLEQRH